MGAGVISEGVTLEGSKLDPHKVKSKRGPFRSRTSRLLARCNGEVGGETPGPGPVPTSVCLGDELWDMGGPGPGLAGIFSSAQ